MRGKNSNKLQTTRRGRSLASIPSLSFEDKVLSDPRVVADRLFNGTAPSSLGLWRELFDLFEQKPELLKEPLIAVYLHPILTQTWRESHVLSTQMLSSVIQGFQKIEAMDDDADDYPLDLEFDAIISYQRFLQKLATSIPSTDEYLNLYLDAMVYHTDCIFSMNQQENNPIISMPEWMLNAYMNVLERSSNNSMSHIKIPRRLICPWIAAINNPKTRLKALDPDRSANFNHIMAKVIFQPYLEKERANVIGQLCYSLRDLNESYNRYRELPVKTNANLQRELGIEFDNYTAEFWEEVSKVAGIKLTDSKGLYQLVWPIMSLRA